jgi:hypothetical protein
MAYGVCKLQAKIFWLADGNRWTQIGKNLEGHALYSAAFDFGVLEIQKQRQSQNGGVEVA